MSIIREETVQHVRKPDHLNDLYYIADGIIGEVCREASLGYADELFLEFGVKWYWPFIDERGRRREFVASRWILGTRGTEWALWRGDQRLVRADDDADAVRAYVPQMIGLVVADYEVTYPSFRLNLHLGRDLHFIIEPSTKDDEYDLPYWQLVTPYNMYLAVGPGRVWSYHRINPDG